MRNYSPAGARIGLDELLTFNRLVVFTMFEFFPSVSMVAQNKTTHQEVTVADFEGKTPVEIDRIVRIQVPEDQQFALISGIRDTEVRGAVGRLFYGTANAKSLGLWDDGCDVTDHDGAGDAPDLMADFEDK